jgi:hypothetical protein
MIILLRALVSLRREIDDGPVRSGRRLRCSRSTDKALNHDHASKLLVGQVAPAAMHACDQSSSLS